MKILRILDTYELCDQRRKLKNCRNNNKII